METEQALDVSLSVPSDSDKENKKKNISKKRCINKTRKRKILTPSDRGNVIQEYMKKEKINSNKKRRFTEACDSIHNSKSKQKSTKNIKKREITLKNVTIDFGQIDAISKCFDYIFKKIRQMRTPFARMGSRRDSQKNELPIVHDEVVIPEHDNENDHSGNAKSNRSDDNVLITEVSIDNEETKVDNDNKCSEQNEVNGSSTSINFTEHNPVVDSRDEDVWVPIGSGKTLIRKDKFRKVKWKSYAIATRTLLLASFPRRILATHTLTGKRLPAFRIKPAKLCLDPKVISDIIMEVKNRFNVKENRIRTTIISKCANECKMYRVRRNQKKYESTKTKQELTADKESTEFVVIEDNITS